MPVLACPFVPHSDPPLVNQTVSSLLCDSYSLLAFLQYHSELFSQFMTQTSTNGYDRVHGRSSATAADTKHASAGRGGWGGFTHRICGVFRELPRLLGCPS